MYEPMFAKLIVWDLDRERETAARIASGRSSEYEPGAYHHHSLTPDPCRNKKWGRAEPARD